MIRFGAVWMLCATLLAAGCATVPPRVADQFNGQAGALQLLITPDDADVYVDAVYRGKARDFTGTTVLLLSRGLHAIEVRHPDYQTFFRQVQGSQGLLEILMYSLHPITE